jgi:hypothetical protein
MREPGIMDMARGCGAVVASLPQAAPPPSFAAVPPQAGCCVLAGRSTAGEGAYSVVPKLGALRRTPAPPSRSEQPPPIFGIARIRAGSDPTPGEFPQLAGNRLTARPPFRERPRTRFGATVCE